MKLTFMPQQDREQDVKALRNLADRVRTKFKVACAGGPGIEQSGELELVIAAVGSREENLSRSLDSICDFCEESGFGRVESEISLIDHVDMLNELAEEEDAENEL